MPIYRMINVVRDKLHQSAAARRRRILARWAAAHGLALSRHQRRDIVEQFPAFKCFNAGDSRYYADNIMSGTWRGRLIMAFDYHCSTWSYALIDSGLNQSYDYAFSTVILKSEAILKSLLIRPEGLGTKIEKLFESTEFNKRFVVQARDKDWPRVVLHEQARKILLRAPAFIIQLEPNWVLVMRNGTFEPGDFTAAATLASDLLDVLPEGAAGQPGRSVSKRKTARLRLRGGGGFWHPRSNPRKRR